MADVHELRWTIDPAMVRPGRVALSTLAGPGLDHGRRRPGIVPIEVAGGMVVAIAVVALEGGSLATIGLVAVIVLAFALGLRWKALRDGHARHLRTLDPHTVVATASGLRVTSTHGHGRHQRWRGLRIAGGWRCPVVQGRSTLGSAGTALPAAGLVTPGVTPKQAAGILRAWAKPGRSDDPDPDPDEMDDDDDDLDDEVDDDDRDGAAR